MEEVIGFPQSYSRRLAAADQLCESMNRAYDLAHSKIQEFTCPRCGGSGRLEEFSHVADGTCFECNGHKVVTRGKQWSMIAKVRSGASESDRAKIDWMFNATPDVWSRVPADKMRAIETWLRVGPFQGLIALPPAGVARLNEVLDTQPKPF